MEVKWVIKKFSELTPFEVYDILQLRAEVFVVEQNCPYQDVDGKDPESHHLLGMNGEKIIAYTRIVPAGVIYKQASIGRVVTSPSVRRSGMGRELMLQSIQTLYDLFGSVEIKIAAQFYLKNFYESFGFHQISDIFLEDGIEHIYMMK